MKGAGWIGIVMVGAGVLMIWSGIQGVNPLDVVSSVLRNEPLPEPTGDGVADLAAPADTSATVGSGGGTAFDEDGGAAGEGSGGGGGGGW